MGSGKKGVISSIEDKLGTSKAASRVPFQTGGIVSYFRLLQAKVRYDVLDYEIAIQYPKMPLRRHLSNASPSF